MDLPRHIDRLVASGVTISDIAAKVGANRATIYRAWSGAGLRHATAVAIFNIRPKRQKKEPACQQ